MRAKRLLLLAGVQLLILALIGLACLMQAPSTVRGAGLGFTPTPTPTNTPVPTPTLPPTPRTPRTAPSGLTIEKTTSASTVSPGEEVTFVIHVCNEGSAVAADVVVSDALPPELALVEATASQGRVVIEGDDMRAELGALAPDGCAEVTIVARVRDDVPPNTPIRNVGSVGDLYDDTTITTTTTDLLPETGGALSPLVLLAAGVGVAALWGGAALLGRGRQMRQDGFD